ncbi:hypothetical protein Nmel_000427 [Mimus melanotis]
MGLCGSPQIPVQTLSLIYFCLSIPLICVTEKGNLKASFFLCEIFTLSEVWPSGLEWNGWYLIDQHLRSPSVSLSSATVQRPTRSGFLNFVI